MVLLFRPRACVHCYHFIDYRAMLQHLQFLGMTTSFMGIALVTIRYAHGDITAVLQWGFFGVMALVGGIIGGVMAYGDACED